MVEGRVGASSVRDSDYATRLWGTFTFALYFFLFFSSHLPLPTARLFHNLGNAQLQVGYLSFRLYLGLVSCSL